MRLDGTKLQRERERRGWDRVDLAKRCKPKLTSATIGNAEAGRSISPDTALAIHKAFGFDVNEYFLPPFNEGDDAA